MPTAPSLRLITCPCSRLLRLVPCNHRSKERILCIIVLTDTMHHRVDRMCRADYPPAPSRRDDLSAVRERLVGRLQHPHHAQAGPAVVERLLSRGHTVHKGASFELEGPGLVQPWGPHASAPVAHQKVVNRL